MLGLKELHEYEYIAIDVETKGLRWWIPEEGIFGIAITAKDGPTIYVDIRERPDFVEWLKRQKPKKVVNHNIKFDLHMLQSLGVQIDPNICECTMIRACLINEHLNSYSLDYLSKLYLNHTKQNDIYTILAKKFGGAATRDVQIKNLHRAPSYLVAEYAKKDTWLALKLWERQESQIKHQKLERIWTLEKELFPVVYEMERHGVCIDVVGAQKAVGTLDKIMNTRQYELNKQAGFEVNVHATSDIKRLLGAVEKKGDWYTSKGQVLLKTKKGNPSFNSESLQNVNTKETSLILEIRKLFKTKNVFLEGHILGHLNGDRVHSNINQCKGEKGGTITGRLSMYQPALQQIPARDKEIARIIRPLFLPDPDYIWACWDYEQFEYRMFSHYVNDKKIIDKYILNPRFDYHQMVADLTGLPRNPTASGGPNAKQLNLSMIYDMGEASIARTLKMPLSEEENTFTDKKGNIVTYKVAGKEAKEIIEKYHAAIPGVRQLAEDVKAKAKERGYIVSIGGRHHRYPHGNGLHKAKALLCQGSSADCMKKKMIELHNYFKAYEPDCRMYLSVHDEINIGIPKKHPRLLGVIRDITKILENFDGEGTYKLRVPIRTDFGIGYNWAEASGKGV